VDRGWVRDSAVGRAISLAVDKGAIAEDFFFGAVQPAYS